MNFLNSKLPCISPAIVYLQRLTLKTDTCISRYFKTNDFCAFSSFSHSRHFIMATMEKETPAKKAATPSVSQINAEYVTQVITAFIFCICGSVLCCEVFPWCWYAEDKKKSVLIFFCCILCHAKNIKTALHGDRIGQMAVTMAYVQLTICYIFHVYI